MGAALVNFTRGMIRSVAIALALVAVGSEETFAGVPLPPTASQANHEEDPKAVALMKAHESKDQVLDFMQDAMMKTGAFMPAEDKANLAKMDGDLADQKLEEASIRKHIKHKAPTPLKDAEKSEHQAITTIHSTKDVIEKEPKRLTLKEAKSICVTQKKEATTKCANGKEAKALYCKEQHTSDVQCSKRGMKVAADCKVAHETAYNECLRLWKKAKKIIADRKKRLAAPMKVSTKHVEELAKKTKVCEKY